MLMKDDESWTLCNNNEIHIAVIILIINFS